MIWGFHLGISTFNVHVSFCPFSWIPLFWGYCKILNYPFEDNLQLFPGLSDIANRFKNDIWVDKTSLMWCTQLILVSVSKWKINCGCLVWPEMQYNTCNLDLVWAFGGMKITNLKYKMSQGFFEVWLARGAFFTNRKYLEWQSYKPTTTHQPC